MGTTCRALYGGDVICPCVGGTLVAVGLSHKTAAVEFRDRVGVAERQMPEVLREWARQPEIGEIAILSTCNRTEIYALLRSGGVDNFRKWLGERGQVAEADRSKVIYAHIDREAVHHLFRVASGLDSMIVGEPQVLGQVREAVRLGRENGVVGRKLNGLFDAALKAAKRARSETGIDRGAVSISYAAVELARQIFGELNQKEVLVLGAGKMSRLTMDNLRDQGATTCFIANRSAERAEALASEYHAKVLPWDRLEESLARMDIVIASTAAPHYVLTTDIVREAMKARRNRPLFLVDIAAPRDVAPEVAELYNVFLYNIDDLKAVTEENIAARRKEMVRAEELLSEGVDQFMAWTRALEAQGAIVQIREWAEEQRQAELERLIRNRNDMTPEQQKAVEEFSRRLMNKFLDRPSRGVKSAYRAIDNTDEIDQPSEHSGSWILNSLKHFFGVKASEKSIDHKPTPKS